VRVRVKTTRRDGAFFDFRIERRASVILDTPILAGLPLLWERTVR
jgi:hypothetical protein